MKALIRFLIVSLFFLLSIPPNTFSATMPPVNINSNNQKSWKKGMAFAAIGVHSFGRSANAVSGGNIADSGSGNNVFEICKGSPPAVDTIEFGQEKYGVSLLDSSFVLEVIVKPTETCLAPFDSEVLPNGIIVMDGNEGKLVSVANSGQVQQTEYPSLGRFFSVSQMGTMWYYSDIDGTVSYYDIEKGETTLTPISLKPTPDGGSIAVSPDGKKVYIGYFELLDSNLCNSILYLYDPAKKQLTKLFQKSGAAFPLNSIEVATTGVVYFAMGNTIYKLEENDVPAVFYGNHTEFGGVSQNGLTSDSQGNLYFSVFDSTKSGIVKLSPNKELSWIKTFQSPDDLPYGLSFHNGTKSVIGVIRTNGQLLAINIAGEVNVLNNPSGYITPIALKEYYNGSIITNGDEVGLYSIGEEGVVKKIAHEPMVPFQPPPADFVLDKTNTIYYTFAAPGFENKIVKITPFGTIEPIVTDVGAPSGIAIAPNSDLYFADFDRGGIYKFDDSGKTIEIIGGLFHPKGLVVDSSNNFWVGTAEEGIPHNEMSLGDFLCTKLLKFGPGNVKEEIIRYDNADQHITFFDIDSQGNLYLPVSGSAGSKVVLISNEGIQTDIAQGFLSAAGAEVASDGSIYITDYPAGALYRLRHKMQSCFSIGADLNLEIPCAEYAGTRYGFVLNYYNNSGDPSGLYWKMDLNTLKEGSSGECLSIGNDLSLTISCAEYSGTRYGFTLRFYSNPNDPSGYYWKMDMSTLMVK